MIKLSGGFTPIPEGVYVFKITKVEYKPDFGKLLVTMQTKTGRTHVETFRLLNGSGEPNAGAMAAFSYFAKTVMNDYDLEEIDEQAMVGHYIKATIEHQKVESNKEPGKILTFVQMSSKEPASGFDDEEQAEAASDDADDFLSSLLG